MMGQSFADRNYRWLKVNNFDKNNSEPFRLIKKKNGKPGKGDEALRGLGPVYFPDYAPDCP
jgi:hypothetical protein